MGKQCPHCRGQVCCDRAADDLTAHQHLRSAYAVTTEDVERWQRIRDEQYPDLYKTTAARKIADAEPYSFETIRKYLR